MKKSYRITNIAMIAAIYFIVSMAFQFMAFGPIQVRIAEALIITALLSVDGIYGLTLGCLITNTMGVLLMVNGFGAIDIVFGTLFTLFSSILAYMFRNIRMFKIKLPIVSLMMPVIINAIGLPIIFSLVLFNEFYLGVYLFDFMTIFIGQFIACVGLGGLIYHKYSRQLGQLLNKK
ncbi:MAG: QueT transporter family protein [Erysipelothrix sp.]|nr:QueT transporter family protein [Erysipelothrix sp.]